MKKIKLFLGFSIIILLFSCEENGIGTYNSSFLDNNVGDQYNSNGENPFINVFDTPVSTFSIDADGASYANVRRFIQQDYRLPPVNAVRTEELINYFNLDYDYENNGHPVGLNAEISNCPWDTNHKLVRIGIKGEPINEEELPPSNFVFLIDVSGSMSSPDKLDLLKLGFNLFVDELSNEDRISIVTYAGASQVILQSTLGSEKQTIKNAINLLGAGGSTAGAQGIITAYDIAQENLVDGNNRIVIGTDGDFNIGISNQDALIELIEEKRDLGIFLTVLGVGRGNLNDGALEQIANNGNGNYEYLDNIEQLKKVFIYDYNKFFTVAKDVKVQVDFNPEKIQAYRLIGYENRILSEEGFEDDTEDAGEIGANQNITALYEVIPTPGLDDFNIKSLTIDFRYKEPNSNSSIPLSLDVYDQGLTFNESSDFMKFTASIASFSMLLTDSDYKGNSSFNMVESWLDMCNLNDEHGFKTQLKTIVNTASIY